MFWRIASYLVCCGAVTSLAAATELPAWVTAKPTPETQHQKTASERGVSPCFTPEPGFGSYEHWRRGLSQGQFIMPRRGGVRADGSFDLMVHFHGHEAVRKEWVQVMDGAMLAGIDLGLGSGPYESAFASPQAFEDLVASIERAVAKERGRSHAHVRHLGLSAWSAGYGAIQNILAQPLGKRADTVILLDGLHAGYVDGHVDGRQIQAFVQEAKRAARSEVMFFFSHSSIIPPLYASTTETASWLIHEVGGVRRSAKRRNHEVMGLELISRFDRGEFHVRGYAGNDKADHCAHIGLFRDIVAARVKPRWHTPRGRL